MEKINNKLLEPESSSIFFPSPGDKLYLSQRTGSYYVDMVKHPYTVIEVDKEKNRVVVQECELVFPYPRYYDTVASEILANPRGRVKHLTWSKKDEEWVYKDSPQDRYPEFATFGEWLHQPYLD